MPAFTAVSTTIVVFILLVRRNVMIGHLGQGMFEIFSQAPVVG